MPPAEQSFSEWWKTELARGGPSLVDHTKDVRALALLVTLILPWGGIGLMLAMDSTLPAAAFWCVFSALMYKYRVSWYFGGALARRDYEPRRYWIGFCFGVLVTVVFFILA